MFHAPRNYASLPGDEAWGKIQFKTWRVRPSPEENAGDVILKTTMYPAGYFLAILQDGWGTAYYELALVAAIFRDR